MNPKKEAYKYSAFEASLRNPIELADVSEGFIKENKEQESREQLIYFVIYYDQTLVDRLPLSLNFENQRSQREDVKIVSIDLVSISHTS